MRILLATDGSDLSRLAEAFLVQVPFHTEPAVTVVSVVPTPGFPVGDFDGMGMGFDLAEESKEWQNLEALAERRARSAVERLTQKGVACDYVVRTGDPAATLLDLEKELKAGLIVVGRTGIGGQSDALLGSVARKILSYSEASVCVVRPYPKTTVKDSIGRLESDHGATVVVAVDGSKGSEAAVEAVVRSGKRFHKAVAVAAEPLSVLPAGIDHTAFTAAFHQDHLKAVEVGEAARARLAEVSDEAVKVVRPGRPGTVICQEAVANNADAIVLGAKRHGPIERFLIGSVSYEVAVEAPCSVGVIRF